MKFTVAIAIAVISVVASLATVNAAPAVFQATPGMSRSDLPPTGINIQPPVGASNVAPPVGMSNAPRMTFSNQLILDMDNTAHLSPVADQLITLLNHYKRAILSGNHQDKTPYLKDIDAVMIKIRGNKIPKEALESITNVIQSMNQDNISRVLSSYANRA